MHDDPRFLTSPGPWRDPLLEEQWNEQAWEAMARADPGFDDSRMAWVEYLCERGAMLAVEQSCHEGVLLPMDQRAVRLASCPEDMLVPLRRFFEEAPAHVKHLVAFYIYNLVRIERARRTGKADWRPTR